MAARGVQAVLAALKCRTDALPMAAARAGGLALLCSVLASGLAISGCSTQREGPTDAIVRHEIITTLAQGQLRLGCDLACAGTWKQARPALAGLYRNGLWTDLAPEVARIGHGIDLGYFYLARAAEELGHPAAAATYYRLALASQRTCDGMLLNSCDGTPVPAQAREALDRLTGRRPAAVTPPAAPAPPPVPAAAGVPMP